MSWTTIVGIIVLLLLAGTGIFWGSRYKRVDSVPDQNRSNYQTISQSQPVQHGVSGDPMVKYLKMRNRAFDGSRTQYGIPPGSNSTDPWATVMEIGLADGTVTIIALADGSTSVYTSSGLFYIGGGEHQSLNAAARHMVAAVREVQPVMHHTQEYLLPQRGHIVFYALTDSGIFTAAAPQTGFADPNQPMAKLYTLGEQIVAEYRRIGGM